MLSGAAPARSLGAGQQGGQGKGDITRRHVSVSRLQSPRLRLLGTLSVAPAPQAGGGRRALAAACGGPARLGRGCGWPGVRVVRGPAGGPSCRRLQVGEARLPVVGSRARARGRLRLQAEGRAEGRAAWEERRGAEAGRHRRGARHNACAAGTGAVREGTAAGGAQNGALQRRRPPPPFPSPPPECRSRIRRALGACSPRAPASWPRWSGRAGAGAAGRRGQGRGLASRKGRGGAGEGGRAMRVRYPAQRSRGGSRVLLHAGCCTRCRMQAACHGR
jgi:hypothetical protein